MAAPLIPMKPPGKFDLTENEQAGLAWYVLSGCNKKEAFLKFVRPDFLVSNKNGAIISSVMSQFFSSKNVQDFIEAYRELIEKKLGDSPRPSVEPSEKKIDGTLEERKSLALSKLVEYVLSQAEKINDSEDPKAILDYANKIGLFDVDPEVVEAPRRYLPVDCSHCAYRQFCEDNTEDMCQCCRYRKYGEENGVFFEKEKMLDIPENFGTNIAGGDE